jgi:RND family efflux transporter MFP subunit
MSYFDRVKSIVFLNISCLMLLACNGNQDDGNIEKPLRPVKSITIEHPQSGRVMEYTAVVDASQKADLSFKVPGEIIKIHVNQGDEVKKGEILAELDDTDYKLNLQEAKAAYQKAKSDFDRGSNLIKSNVISSADFDKLKSDYLSSNAKLESAKNNLSYTKLIASFSGIVAKKYSENFQEVNAKQPILALHNIREVDLKIDVPESVMIQIPRNDKSREIVAIFDEIPNQEFPVQFKEIATQADEVTKTYEATFTMVSPPKHTVLPGMTAILRGTKRLNTSDETQRYYLPSNAVLKDSSGNFVWIVVAQDKGVGKIEKVMITIGDITGQGIEVFSGVSAGQELVVAGVSKVTDGMLVKFIKD